MPRGGYSYVPAPTDPAYYDALAAGDNAMLKGAVSAVSDIAGGAFSYVKNKQDNSSKQQMIKGLYEAFLAEGISEPMARQAAFEYVQKGTQELLDAYGKRQSLAADLKAKEAGTAQTETETREIAPNAAASRASLGASTALTQAQTTDIPEDTAIQRMGAETTRQDVQGNLGMRRDELTAKIDKETRDFVLASDADASGSIDPKEARDLLTRNRAAVREKVRKAKMQKADAFKDSEETNRYRSMTSPQIDEEAKAITREQIEDINFGKENAMDIASGGNQTQAAIRAIGSRPLRSGITPEEIRAGIAEKFPDANVDEVLKAISGF